jgi:hypothetical protein
MATVRNWDTDEDVVVRVGDWVGFKSDVEQSGEIIRIEGDRLYLRSGAMGFQGGYIGGQDETVESARDCWI